MKNLDEEQLVELHNEICTHFGIPTEVKDRGILKSIVERPNTIIFGNYEPYDNIFKKAASLMESIIRWHPFIDGNKRTATLAMMMYLYENDYSLILPLSAVRYIVDMAKNQSRSEEDNEKLINEISAWLQKLAIGKEEIGLSKIMRYSFIQACVAVLASIPILGRRASAKIGYWLALDIYPANEKKTYEILMFLIKTTRRSFTGK